MNLQSFESSFTPNLVRSGLYCHQLLECVTLEYQRERAVYNYYCLQNTDVTDTGETNKITSSKCKSRRGFCFLLFYNLTMQVPLLNKSSLISTLMLT